MESIDTHNSWHRTPRLSLDAQFWLRIGCVLPFSLAAWGVFLWWSFQEVPIYASQWVEKISSWSEAVTASAATVLNGGGGDTDNAMAEPANHHVSRPLSSYSQRWQWRALSDASWLWVHGNKDAFISKASAREGKFRQNKEEDPFGVIKFLDFLRRSQGSSVAFVHPHSLFPITQHAVDGSRHGSGLPSTAHHDFATLAPSHFNNHWTFAFVPLLQAVLPKELALDREMAITD